MKFSDLKLSDSILDGLRDLQFETPTPIQEKSIPSVLEGHDIIATAQTGTGKTGAFAIPLIQRVIDSDRKGTKALILSPTRELAQQIDEQIYAIGYHSGVSSVTVIGGSDFASQAKALKGGVEIIVATPGRLMDQKKVSDFDFSGIEIFVLDEADRMLDMGFLPDIKKIISWLPEKRQNLLFSATMPDEIVKLTKAFMKDPVTVNIARSKPNQNVKQYAYRVSSDQKIHLVQEILHQIKWESCILFTSTKKGTDELERLLKKEGIAAVSIHGDRTQEERNKALQKFVNGEIAVMVATDVLARGIDIKGISMIINYDIPNTTDDYVHRIGRTGRYDRSGVAITFATKRDANALREISSIKDSIIKIVDVPETYSGGTGSIHLGLDPELLNEKTANTERPKKVADVPKTERKTQPMPHPAPAQKALQGSYSKPHSETDSSRDKNNGRSVSTHKPSGPATFVPKQSIQKVNSVDEVLIVEKAVKRATSYPKPRKGMAGLLRSFFPSFRKN